MSSLDILVVDDFEPWRRVVCSTLQLMPQRQIIYQAADGLETVQKALELQPDLILLDIGLPIMDGVEAARQIRKLAPRSKVLFLSENHSAEVAREALFHGASGYVVKADAGRQLLDAVEAVIQGKQFVSDSIAGQVFAEGVVTSQCP